MRKTIFYTENLFERFLIIAIEHNQDNYFVYEKREKSLQLLSFCQSDFLNYQQKNGYDFHFTKNGFFDYEIEQIIEILEFNFNGLKECLSETK